MRSPPRVMLEAQKFGPQAGEAVDLITGWDFSTKFDQDRATQYLKTIHRPKLVIGSPTCKMFSQLQRLSPWSGEKERRWREDWNHLKFMAEVLSASS